jgi:hypothetical protein
LRKASRELRGGPTKDPERRRDDEEETKGIERKREECRTNRKRKGTKVRLRLKSML